MRSRVPRSCRPQIRVVATVIRSRSAVGIAGTKGDRLSRLVLVDTFGLSRFRPAPSFALALVPYIARPTERTHDRLWQRCALDLDRVRQEMGEDWEPFKAYNLDRARTPSVKAALRVLMRQLGVPAIPSADLARIAVPTTLIWGRHDLGTRLRIAEAASARYGWPLHVIENAAADPPIERPEAFLGALRPALGSLEWSSPRARASVDARST